MLIRVSELRRLVRRGLAEGITLDSYFLETIIPDLVERELLPVQLGRLLGNGHEAYVFEVDAARVIRLQPTYQDDRSHADELEARLRNAPSGGMHAEVYEVGKVEGFDYESGEEDVCFAVYAIMERLEPISAGDAHDIDEVVLGRMTPDDEDLPPKLREFMQAYMKTPHDHDSRNVMRRGDEYVIIDPE